MPSPWMGINYFEKKYDQKSGSEPEKSPQETHRSLELRILHQEKHALLRRYKYDADSEQARCHLHNQCAYVDEADEF